MRSPCTSRMREVANPPISAWRTLAGSAPALRGEQQRLADRLDVQRDDDLVGDLGGLPVAVAADQRDVLAHQFEQRLDPVERLLRAADHDGQARRLRADLAARDRRVEIVAAELVDARANSLVAIGEIELMSTTVLPADSPAATPSVVEQHRAPRAACRAP